MFNWGAYRSIGVAVLLCALSFAAPAHAEYVSDNLSLNGFFTLDASLSHGGSNSLPGSNGLVDLKQDQVNYDNSTLGLQAAYDLTTNLRMTLQGVLGKHNSSDYTTSLDWAYLNYDMGDDLQLRTGQFRPPFLQGTELRDVGYSRLWAHPLIPTNGTGGFKTYQGIEFIKRTPVGGYNLTLQGGAGIAEHNKSSVDNHNIGILSVRMEKDESWLTLSVFRADSTYYNPNTSALINSHGMSRGSSAEAELLFGANQFNLGLADVTNDVGPNEQLRYLSWGHRMGRFTPYLLYQYQARIFPTLPSPPPGAPPPPNPPPLSGTEATTSYSLGMRYDLGERYDIKAQVGRNATTNSGSDTTVYSLVLEGAF